MIFFVFMIEFVYCIAFRQERHVTENKKSARQKEVRHFNKYLL